MKRLVLCMLLALVTLPIVSLEIGGVLLPDNLNVAGQELQLNGAGLRKKAFIKVYACGLYMPAASSDADAILADSTAIVVRMHFIYKKVGAKKLISAWNEGFENAGFQQTFASEIQTFNSFFSQDAKKNDVYDISYLPGTGIQISRNNSVVGTIPNPAFRKAVFSIWLGDKTALPGLKKKLLNL